MATGPGVNQGKTAFVEEFLTGNRDASFAKVNEAWKSSGNKGTVSESLVKKARSRLKLTRKKSANGLSSESNAGPATQGKSPKGTRGKGVSNAREALLSPMGREGGARLSKTAFVEEILGREPKANVKAINRAWAAAGNEGTISDSVVYKLKRDLGVTGRRLPVASVAGGPTMSQARGEPDSGRTAAMLTSQGSGQGRLLHEIEGEIDELLFRLKALGDFAEVQEALRAARRLLVRSHGE